MLLEVNPTLLYRPRPPFSNACIIVSCNIIGQSVGLAIARPRNRVFILGWNRCISPPPPEASSPASEPIEPAIGRVPLWLCLWGYCGRDVKLVTYLHLVPRPRILGAAPPPLHTSWRGAELNRENFVLKHLTWYTGWDSAVGVATGCGPDGRVPVWSRIFSSPHVVQAGSGAHPAPCAMGTGGKAAGAWSWPLTSN
jgi:hypothetical protein